MTACSSREFICYASLDLFIAVLAGNLEGELATTMFIYEAEGKSVAIEFLTGVRWLLGAASERYDT